MTRLVAETEPIETIFCDLKVGNIFVQHDHFYLKVVEITLHGDRHNAVALSTGELVFFSAGEFVTLVKEAVMRY